jgi:catechol 2,3-dioxygenase-like lactoylglutathione lyase family enzyme
MAGSPVAHSSPLALPGCDVLTAMSSYRPSHLGICVSDLDRSLRFYCDGLGFEVGDRYDLSTAQIPDIHKGLEVEAPVTVTSQMIVNGAMKVELIHYPAREPEGAPSTSRAQLGLTHLSFNVKKVDEATALLVEHGGTILESTRANVGIEIVFLTDPDGTRIELMGGS